MKKLITLFSLLSPFILTAQNDLQFSHFMFNEITLNPAATGNSTKLITSLVGRQQWLGVENAPSTQFLNAHAYIDPVQGGIGITILNDKLGYENIMNVKLNYAYHLNITSESSLSGGLGIGFINRRLDGSKLIFEEGGDPQSINSRISVFKPDLAFGLEFNSRNITAGLSSTHIHRSLNASDIQNVPRHYFLYAKYKIKATEEFDVIPALLVKSSWFIHQYEMNTNVMYMEKFWLGASYRYKESIVGIIGAQVTDYIRIGYSYDFNAQPINTYSSGSHEIMLQGLFKGFSKKKHNYKSPRFFN